VFLLDVTTGLRMGFESMVQVFGFSISQTDFWRFTTGPAAHFHYSHSTLWASMGFIVLSSLMLLHWYQEKQLRWRKASALSMLTVLTFPLNVFAGMAASGVFVAVNLIRRRKKWESWLLGAAIIISAIGILWIMGIGRAGQYYPSTLLGSSIEAIFLTVAERTVTLFWIFLGFGAGLVLLGSIISQPQLPLTLISLVLAVGGFLFSAFLRIGGPFNDDLYFLRIFYHFSVVCSLAILSGIVREWVDGKGTGSFVECAVGLSRIVALVSLSYLALQLLVWVISLIGAHPFYDGIVRVVVPVLTASLSYWLWRNVRRSFPARFVFLAIIMCVFVAQLAGATWRIYTNTFEAPLVSNNPLLILDRQELQGLVQLRAISQPNDLCATNRNLGDHYLKDIEKSGTSFQVLYTPISERRFLIETPHPFAKIGSGEVRSDNRLLFENTDLQSIHDVINKHRIRYLVCEPGTDLAIANNLPKWLYRAQNTGSLKIYQVRNGT
ncbi:MAG: hypothetical protein L7F78_04995, partial [Syntrophales bacterium LBB04]|nr:hypothetical protein [Syntrophales bacterium LBB04]